MDLINQFDYQYNHTDFQLDQRSDEIVSGVTVPNPLQNEILSYHNNNLNQLLQVTKNQEPETTNLIYDSDGNLTKGYTPEGYEFTADYDAENRLKSIVYIDSQAKVHTTVYTYRADSFLVKIEKFENQVKTSETDFIGEGFLIVEERATAAGQPVKVKNYIWGQNLGGGIGGLLALIDKTEAKTYDYIYDGKGNVVAVIDNNQETVATYTYDEFGKVTSQTGTLDQPFQFSTKFFDKDIGLNYYGYRFYSSTLCRWINRDPLGEEGGINLYEFAWNNPINAIDPDGQLVWYLVWLFRLAPLTPYIPAVNQALSKPYGPPMVGAIKEAYDKAQRQKQEKQERERREHEKRMGEYEELLKDIQKSREELKPICKKFNVQ